MRGLCPRSLVLISCLFCVCDTADALLYKYCFGLASKPVVAATCALYRGGRRENSAQRKFRTGAEKAEGALDAAEKRASTAEAKLKKLEAEMPYLKGALEAKERRASAAEKALDAADNA